MTKGEHPKKGGQEEKSQVTGTKAASMILDTNQIERRLQREEVLIDQNIEKAIKTMEEINIEMIKNQGMTGEIKKKSKEGRTQENINETIITGLRSIKVKEANILHITMADISKGQEVKEIEETIERNMDLEILTKKKSIINLKDTMRRIVETREGTPKNLIEVIRSGEEISTNKVMQHIDQIDKIIENIIIIFLAEVRRKISIVIKKVRMIP